MKPWTDTGMAMRNAAPVVPVVGTRDRRSGFDRRAVLRAIARVPVVPSPEDWAVVLQRAVDAFSPAREGSQSCE